MLKRMFNEYGYTVETKKGVYIVLYNRLKNTNSGCPKYEFRIIKKDPEKWIFAAVYRATGHYIGDKQECEWIVAQYENEIEKECV